MTDQELIEGILHRDRNAFQCLVNQYQKQVIKAAYHFVGNLEDAEDLSQEIFLDVIRSLPSFNKSSSLSTWIYRITVNKSLNMVKKKQRRGIMVRIESLFRPPVEHGSTHTTEPSVLPADLEHQEKQSLLHAAINRLPENQRIAFVLCKFEDHTYKQIAEIMKIGLPAVESLIHRAKVNLQQHLVHHFSEYQKT
ncbi:MAG: sigma-70 family RNA polymerase sigma factor [Bacteroidetes bacterium]|nr:sigma-70 family RNA polymerase sigma factor [Bacteroidota bacterium]